VGPSLSCDRMGKAKKELTNQRRAQRLGTGAGIAPASKQRSGAMPAWAWFVSGSVLLAAVIIATAFLVTRSSNSPNQSSSVVQDRLTHSKIDFVAAGTWPPNYTNLAGALTKLGIDPANEVNPVVHYHWHLTVYAGGRNVVIPRNIGLQNPPAMSSEIHTHSVATDKHSGIIHVESSVPGFQATILEFFDVWGVYASNPCLGGYCNGVKVYVNGKLAPAGLNTKPKEHDAVTVVAGSLPPGVTPATKYTDFTPGE
jgi:hypothetical protein